MEGLEEESRGNKAIGTTRKGIGPAFADKTARMGIRVGDLLDKTALKERLQAALEYKNAIITKVYGKDPLSFDEIYKQYWDYGEKLASHIKETTILIDEAIKAGKQVLLEGAQGTMLDPDFGTYPYATSSSPLAGGGCIGAGIGPTRLNAIVGVFKAYITRVGAGPMPTFLRDKTGEMLRESGVEYGTTTGRPRNCGWFDAVVARFSTRLNGFTGAAITKLDVLDTMPSLKICTAYKFEGKTIDNVPARISDMERCEPVYEEMPGWQISTRAIRSFKDMPEAAQNYLNRLEELIGCPINLVSVGSAREETLTKTPIL
jgi:adenylosuccinate synthase